MSPNRRPSRGLIERVVTPISLGVREPRYGDI